MSDPVVYTNDLETGLAYERPEGCKPVPRVISKSKLLSALFIAIPIVNLISNKYTFIVGKTSAVVLTIPL